MTRNVKCGLEKEDYQFCNTFLMLHPFRTLTRSQFIFVLYLISNKDKLTLRARECSKRNAILIILLNIVNTYSIISILIYLYIDLYIDSRLSFNKLPFQ